MSSASSASSVTTSFLTIAAIRCFSRSRIFFSRPALPPCAASLPFEITISASAARIMLFIQRSSFPVSRNRLADLARLIRTRLRPELLHATAVDFGHVEIPFLIDAHPVHPPERTWKHPERAPRIQEVSLLVVLQQLVRTAIERPDVPILADVQQMQARRLGVDAP